MVLKVKKKSGKIEDYPAAKVRNLMGTIGFSGSSLVKATSSVIKEAKKLAKAGIITATGFEKAIVRAVNNTNAAIINTTQKITRKVLK